MRPRLRSFDNAGSVAETGFGGEDSSDMRTTDVVALQKKNLALTEQLRDLEEIGTRMHAEITALRKLTATVGDVDGAHAAVAGLTEQLTAVTRERDELRSRWAGLSAAYREGVACPGSAVDTDESDISQVVSCIQISR